MADVIDRHVVVLAPEKRYRVEALVQSQHVARRGLSLAFSNYPMLDADVFAGMRIRPTRDIAGGVNVAGACLEVPIDHHAAIDLKAGLLGKHQTRAHADADDHEVGVHCGAALEY